MKLFGQADKPKKYQDSVKAETAKVEAVRNQELKRYEELERTVAARKAEEDLAFEERKKKHEHELAEVVLERKRVEHWIEEGSHNFKSTQKRLNDLELSLNERKEVIKGEEAVMQRLLGSAATDATKARANLKHSEKIQENAEALSDRIIQDANDMAFISAREAKQNALEAKKIERLRLQIEAHQEKVILQEKRVKALEENLIYREKELEKRTKRVVSKETALKLAHDSMYGKNRR